MKKTGKKTAAGLLCLALLSAGFFIAGKLWKNPASIPSLEVLEEHDEAFAHKNLEGFLREQIEAALGDPDEQSEQDDVWILGEGKQLKISYNNSRKAAAVSLQVRFRDEWYSVSDLSGETVDWLERYNGLTEDEQLAISFIPGDLLRLSGIKGEDAAADETEAGAGTESEPETEAGAGSESEPETEADAGSESSRTVPVITKEMAAFEGLPGRRDFKTITAGMDPVPDGTEEVFGGSPGKSWTIVSGSFTFFYFQNEGSTEYTDMNFAITGETVRLGCGIHVGMRAEKAEEIIPGLYHTSPDTEDPAGWNPASFPDGWCQQFSEILIARVEHDGELPLYLGLMVDEEGIIRAISFEFPTAG